jgi:hypothetical protein
MLTDAAEDTITISFIDLTPAEASQLAKELELELIEAGVPKSDMQVVRDNAEAMDMGGIVMVAAGAYLFDLAKEAGKEFAKGAANRAGTRVLDWLLHKWGTRAEIQSRSGPPVIVGEEYKRLGPPRPGSAPEQVADLKTLGVVILGASQFPHMPASRKLDNPAFKRSAELAKRLFSPECTVFRDTAVLDLFDTEARIDDIVDRIEQHVAADPEMRDVVLYYCGHGDFLPDRERSYYLTLRATRPGREPATGLLLKPFRYMIEQQPKLIDRRFYFVLDCCFAGAAVEVFQLGGIDPLVASQVREMLPERGWAFLTASDRSMPAIGRDGAGATMFTGALADVLSGGAPGVPPRLTLADLCAETARHIKTKYGLAGVLPQCHAPRQDAGDVSRVTMFVREPSPPSQWEQLQTSNDIYRLRRFAERFPGHYGDLALRRIADLKQRVKPEHSSELGEFSLVSSGDGLVSAWKIEEGHTALAGESIVVIEGDGREAMANIVPETATLVRIWAAPGARIRAGDVLATMRRLTVTSAKRAPGFDQW